MNKSLSTQLIVLAILSILFGIANNMRPSAKIEWIRDWPAFSSLSSFEEKAEDVKPEQATAEIAESVDEGEAQAKISERVATNAGITDLSLAEAKEIFKHAGDITFWIDARDPDLYNEGHIQGSRMLPLYSKNEYLPQIQGEIAEADPLALVVYCKGKECTDSHHLAQDLEGLGYENIFVYKGGFEEWYEAGLPIEGTLATNTAPDQENSQNNEELAAITSEMIATNQGITDINIEQANNIFKHASDLTFWIDARDPELYGQGHIKGSRLLYLYEKNDYIPTVQEEITEKDPLALVVYCKGEECTDSHHLAQDLEMMGYENIFVYKGGFEEWYEAGLPIEGTLAEKATETAVDDVAVTRELPVTKEGGMYLEHVLRDMIPFLFGLLLLAMHKKTFDSKALVNVASFFVGAFFVWAAWSKIGNPMLFAKNIWNYDLAPGGIINFTALFMPALELLCGIGLMTGFFRRGSALYVSGMLVLFIVAVGFNVIRQHEFNCGCTSGETMFSEAYLNGWNDKITLILRDFGLLVMSWMGYRGVKEKL